MTERELLGTAGIPPVLGASQVEFQRVVGYPISRIRVWVQYVTPEQAKAWLEGKEGALLNRSRRPRRIDTIARDMASKKFAFTGVPLVFDSEGHLIDGQHRCAAGVQSRQGFWTICVAGVDRKKAVVAIDDTAARTTGDRLKMRLDPPNANNCAAAALLIWQFSRPDRSSSWGKPSYGEVEATFKKYRGDIEWAVDAIGAKIEPGLSSGGGPIHAAFAFAHPVNRAAIEKAAQVYKTGQVAGQNDPMRALRAFMSSMPDRAEAGNKNTSSMYSRHAVALVALGYLERVLLGTQTNRKLEADVGVIERITARMAG